MSAVRVPAGTRAPASFVSDVIAGKPWTARQIRNNNLRQHCRVIGRIFSTNCKGTGRLRPLFLRLAGAVAERACIFTGLHPNAMQVVPALLRLCTYAEQWKRQPEDWQPPADCMAPRAQWEHLVSHLFDSWPLPRFLVSAWETFGTLRHVERDWYCHAAAGLSMREAPGMPATITNRALHLMMQAPDHVAVRQAMRWGQATAAGCGDSLRDEIIASSMANDLSTTSSGRA